MGGELRLALTEESMHALGEREWRKLDQCLSVSLIIRRQNHGMS